MSEKVSIKCSTRIVHHNNYCHHRTGFPARSLVIRIRHKIHNPVIRLVRKAAIHRRFPRRVDRAAHDVPGPG